MDCPRCGHKEVDAECPACGVVVAKVLARKELPRPSQFGVTATAPPSPARSGAIWLVALMLVVGVTVSALAWWKSAHREGGVPRGTVAVAPVPTAGLTLPQAPGLGEPPAPADEEAPPRVASPLAPKASTLPPSATSPPLTPAVPRVVDAVVCGAFAADLPELPKRTAATFGAWEQGAPGHDSVLHDQERSGASALVYFYTDWCGYCRKLNQGLLDRPDANHALSRFARVRINPERGARERALAGRYGVRGYPSIYFLSQPGAAPRAVRPYDAQGTLMSPDEFSQSLAARDRADVQRRVRQAYERLRLGDVQGALSALALAGAMEPSYAPVHYWRAMTHLRSGAKDKAVIDLRLALQLAANDKSAAVQLASLALLGGCQDAAKDTLAKACDLGVETACARGPRSF